VPRIIGLARPTTNYPKINRIKCGLFVSIGMLMMAPKLSAQGISVGSKDLNAICQLSINDKTYLDGPCKYEYSNHLQGNDYFQDNRVAIACQANGSGPCSVTTPGVFGYLRTSSKGDAELCWNEMGSAHAQTCFLGLSRAGACWINPVAKGRYSSQLKTVIRFCVWAR
jgi:hypothetical protein